MSLIEKVRGALTGADGRVAEERVQAGADLASLGLPEC
jgi:hypothetical protein